MPNFGIVKVTIFGNEIEQIAKTEHAQLPIDILKLAIKIFEIRDYDSGWPLNLYLSTPQVQVEVHVQSLFKVVNYNSA